MLASAKVNLLEAELYALTHRGNPGDIAFYAKACKGVDSVLELGAGYGRLIPALAHVAAKVVALDCEPSLIAAARRQIRALPELERRRASCVLANMQSFELRDRFDRIILPYNGLYCLPNRRAVLSCFRRARRHLTQTGQFVFDVWAADEFDNTAESPAHYDDTGPILSLCHRGQTWDVFETSHLRSHIQRLDVVYTYVPRVSGSIVRIPIAQRYAPAKELVGLLQVAGMQVVASFGGFRGQRRTGKSAHCVIVAEGTAGR